MNSLAHWAALFLLVLAIIVSIAYYIYHFYKWYKSEITNRNADLIFSIVITLHIILAAALLFATGMFIM